MLGAVQPDSSVLLCPLCPKPTLYFLLCGPQASPRSSLAVAPSLTLVQEGRSDTFCKEQISEPQAGPAGEAGPAPAGALIVCVAVCGNTGEPGPVPPQLRAQTQLLRTQWRRVLETLPSAHP